VDREFHSALKDRLQTRQDLGTSMADTVRLGEGPHWKQRYYFEKFKVKQDDLVDFLQRIRKAYIEGLCWVLVYYYQGCQSWTWFYPYHYAPFASDLIGCANLKCADKGYFQMGTPFMPFQQLMSVLPPVSAKEAGIPKAMVELMEQPFSPIIDFYPADFGLDLNGKRFTWQAVILLPFIDEPRLVRILAPLLKNLNNIEKTRNRRGQEILFGHKDDKNLLHAVQLSQAAFEAGHSDKVQHLKNDHLFGSLQGWQFGGSGRTVVSPIEGLPDVEESHCVSSMFTDPVGGLHMSVMLPGIDQTALVINAADMDENARLKGFGGEPAKRMILQALGKDPKQKPRYQDVKDMPGAKVVGTDGERGKGGKDGGKGKKGGKDGGKGKFGGGKVGGKPAPAPKPQVQEDTGHWGDEMNWEEDTTDASAATGSHPAPPPGSKVIKVHAVTQKPQATAPAPPAGYQPVHRNKGCGKGKAAAPAAVSRAAPF